MAKEAPAEGSNRLATSTRATWAQDNRSSRLTWPGSEMSAATALTAKDASGMCSVTSASTSASVVWTEKDARVVPWSPKRRCRGQAQW